MSAEYYFFNYFNVHSVLVVAPQQLVAAPQTFLAAREKAAHASITESLKMDVKFGFYGICFL